MAVEIRESIWEVDVEVLETVALDLDDPATLELYPRLKLRPTSERAVVSLKTIEIENDYLLIVIVPDLGGRIVRIFDKRTKIEVWDMPQSLQSQTSVNGPWIQSGLQWLVGPHYLDSMGPVNFSIIDPMDEESLGGVFVGRVTVDGFDWSACVSLAPDTATILLEFRVHNRTILPQIIEARIGFDSGKSVVRFRDNTLLTYDNQRQSGLAFTWSMGEVSTARRVTEGNVQLTMSRHASFFDPRESRSMKVRVQPVTGLPSVDALTSEVALSISGETVALQSAKDHIRTKVVVRCQSGQSLETQLDLTPESVFKAEIGEPVDAVAIVQNGQVIVQSTQPFEQLSGEFEFIPEQKSSRASSLMGALSNVRRGQTETAEEEFLMSVIEGTPLYTHVPGLEGANALMHANSHCKTGDFVACLEAVDRSLSKNGDDPLAWWLRSAAERNIDNSQERDGLLNAQFLAPLDPILRAEAFLSTPIAGGPGPSPLVQPLAEDPDALLDVCGHLIDAGLYQDTSRLIEESLRHRDTPMVRLLFAWCLLSFSRMEAEAAEQVRLATASPLAPPFPHRPNEIRAVYDLDLKFPANPNLQRLKELLILTKPSS